MKKVYLDYTATAPVKEEVAKEMLKYLTESFGNPSSIHSFGLENRENLAKARDTIAATLNCKAEEIYFTSGGTEADNWALRGIAKAHASKGKHIITSKIEHHAILHTAAALEKEGFEVTYLDVDEYGLVNPDDLRAAIKDDTILVSIMFVNNEIGTIQDIDTLGNICREKSVIFHTDAVQAYGNVRIDLSKLPVDLMTMSGHKIYGPKGIGALFVRKGVRIANFIEGGAQERKKRPGTENVPGIMGMAKAAEIAHANLDEHIAGLTELRDYMINRVLKEIDYVKLNGHPTKRHPGNVNFSFRFIEGEAMLIGLDNRGIAASSGSACTSGSLDPSHVLMAIGLPHEIAHGSCRMTIGDFTTKEDIDYSIDALKEVIKWLRDMSPLYEKFVKEQKEK